MSCDWGWEKLGWVDPNPWDGVKNGEFGDIVTLGLVEFGLGWSDPMGWGQKWRNWGCSVVGDGKSWVGLVPSHGMGSKMVEVGMF